MINNIQKILISLPSSPGVYIYRNADNKIIYVGKAINLKKRVSQYFQRDDALGFKTTQLVSQIATIETKTVDSELQALVLEASLIKKYKPKFNSQLRDDKSYAYITITTDDLPLVYSSRRANLNPRYANFGPFPNGGAVRTLLRTIRHVFPYFNKIHPADKLCLYCHLGLCPGPHVDPQIYRQTIGKIKKLLNGNFNSLLVSLKRDMTTASKLQDYEAALSARNQLQSLEYIISSWRGVNSLFEKVDLQDDQVSSALNELKTTLIPYFPFLESINRLECYDISNLGSNYFVGSMVVFQNGQIDKSDYRKFKIYSKTTPDDQLMIREIVWRRLKHPEWPYPQLIVVDGGKPQVASIHQIDRLFPNTALTKIAVIGLAKRLETIVIKEGDDWVEINLPANSTALHLLQRLRDEAHRFANRYRQQLMKLAPTSL